MDKKSRQKIFSKREVIKYSANRAYFGKLTGIGLADAYAQFKHSQDWDKPITKAKVKVGKIDGVVICHALWNEMSYNPLRFGKESPFMYKGREDIYHFCREGVPADFPGFKVIEKIHHKMIDFMMLNGRKLGKWYDIIDTENGSVTIKFVDGHSDDNYKVLSMLREMIRFVTNQNTEDFKHKAYRDQMLTVINKRHPNGIRDNKPVVQLQKLIEDTDSYSEEDRLDKAEESAQITLDNQKYVPEAQFEQAENDIATIRNMKTKSIMR